MKEFLLYSKEIIKHFKKPKNLGRIKNPDGIGEAGNLLCGDVLRVYLKIKKDKKGKERISDIKFETFGCMVAIANSSLLTTLVKGKSLEQALKISKDDLLKKLGKPLPPFKIHCSILAVDALKEAIYNYYERKKLPIPYNLRKEHKRIKKIFKLLEKRYKEFVKLERKILGK